MKKIVLILTLILPISVSAQEMATIMEKRAREMHRVIGTNDKQVWIEFVKENYTQTLIDRQQTMKVQSNDGNKSSQSTEKISDADKLEAKAKMFARLHQDFGGSKITSIKSKAEELEMVLDNGEGLVGTFKLKFEKSKPYRIDGIGIEAGN